MQFELSLINGKTPNLAVGKRVNEQAVASGQERRLSDFFYETAR